MKIGVGLSGGVDSTVTASILLEAGHQVQGFTMLLMPGVEEAVEKGAAVAKKLGIQHHILDLRKQFQQLILSYFVDSYASGRTPSPCVRCNRLVKFGLLWEAMREKGCEAMATGHYARILFENNQPNLLRGTDRKKDQSYFLAQLTSKQLEHTLFPLGDMLKSDIKAKALELALIPESEGESQDLCFLPDGSFADFVAARKPELLQEGWIVDESGKQLGRHTGAFKYTVGQRRGLGLGGGPWFVKHVNMETNTVVVGHQDAVSQHKVLLSSTNWLPQEPPTDAFFQVKAQLRYLMTPKDAILICKGNGYAELDFLEPVPSVPAGQLAAAYQDERVIAGGWIESFI